MRYHYQKPGIYLSMYGRIYICDHPVYSSCTLFEVGDKGLAVIQQRFDADTKSTWWSEVDPWLTDDLYLHPKFKEYFDKRPIVVFAKVAMMVSVVKTVPDMTASIHTTILSSLVKPIMNL